ncbi:MAG: cob(I)yrinic acid a,c-diamide adenosyltransferase [Candidatus Aenigmatarchaeota archaeon]
MKKFGSGDKGETIVGKEKVKKSECLVDALGDLDELNCVLGICRSLIKDNDLKEIIKNIQTKIFEISSIIAGFEKYKISEEDIKNIEKKIESIENSLKPLNNFIYISGSLEFTFLQYARAICRRAERSLWKLKEKRKLDDNVLIYINRLSDFLFSLARLIKERKNENYEVWK